MAAADIGPCAYGILKEGSRHIGATIGISGEHLTGAEMAAALSDTLGEAVSHWPIPFEVYRTFDFPGAADLGNMFQFKHDFNDYFRGAHSVDVSRRLNPALMSFSDWLAANGDRIPRH